MRYKEYNTNRVLEKCTNLFWNKGFNGCAISDITKETGVNRFSLYHEFENKEGILYASLKLYRERYCEEKFDILKADGKIDDIIKSFFLSFLDESNVNRGCYFIHIATELADQNEKISDLVNTFLAEIEALFNNLLLKNNKDEERSKVLSRHLVGLYCTSMSFCLIHTNQQRDKHIETGINIILNKNG